MGHCLLQARFGGIPAKRGQQIPGERGIARSDGAFCFNGRAGTVPAAMLGYQDCALGSQRGKDRANTLAHQPLGCARSQRRVGFEGGPVCTARQLGQFLAVGLE